MKRIVNGKLYSTDSATLKHSWDNGKGETNEDMHKYDAESLYQTDSGEYFIWITKNGNENSIKPVSFDEAVEWLEDVGEVDATIAKIFGVELA